MTTSGSNIVSFPSSRSDAPDEPPPDSLMGQIRSISLEKICAGASTGFDKLIDEIYDLAEHALDRDTRDFYLKAKEEWPRQRKAIETELRNNLVKRFIPATSGKSGTGAQFAEVKSSWSELSLVDDGVLEEDMRFTEIANRIRNGADEELAALDQRIAIVLDRPEMDSNDNPLAPGGIADAFKNALSAANLEIKIKLLVIRALDEGTRPEILKLYKEVNNLLKEKGVLPTVRYGASKKPQSGAGPTTGPRTEGPQVVGSVTLPIVSGGSSAGGAGIVTAQIPLTAGGAGHAAGLAGAGAAGIGGPGTAIPGASVSLSIPTAGVPGSGSDAAADPFAMLQQLMMMNLGAGRGVPGAGAIPPGASAGLAGAPGQAGPSAGSAGAGYPGGYSPDASGAYPSISPNFAGVPGGPGVPGAGGMGGVGVPGYGAPGQPGTGGAGGAGTPGYGIPGQPGPGMATGGYPAHPGGGGVGGYGAGGGGQFPGTGGIGGGAGGAGAPAGGVQGFGAPGTQGEATGGIVTPAGFPPVPPGGTGLPAAPGEITSTFGALAGMLPGGHGSPGQSARLTTSHSYVPGYPGAVMPQGASLIGSLTRLQQGDVGALPDAPPDFGAWLGGQAPSMLTGELPPPTPNVLRALKSTSLGQQMGQMDTVTLDIVAMLFDQIFGDARIAPAMKALIGRLQIPMLKVAVLDKTFFSRKAHPARHMLDTLGELSMGLGEGFAPGTPLYQRIESTLSSLVEQFEEDFGVFDRITAEFEAMISELNQTADAAGKKESKRIQDKERLEVARLFAQNELKQHIEGQTLPRAILRFLSTEWMKLLILAYAKGGRESRAWHSLVETLDILVWSLTPKHTVDERKRMVSILPGLLKRLAKGMEVIGTDRLVRERFNAVLMRCHARTIAGAEATSLFQRSPAPPTRTVTGSIPIPPQLAASDLRSIGPKPSPAAPLDARTDAPPTEEALPAPIDITMAEAHPEQAGPVPEHPADLSIPPAAELTRVEEVPAPSAFVGADGGDSMIVEEVAFDYPGAAQVHDITAPMNEGERAAEPERNVEATTLPPTVQLVEALPLQEEMSAEAAPDVFPAVKVRNPFGDGEIEVEEVSFNDLPGFAGAGSSMAAPLPAPAGDEFSQLAAGLKEGDWVEIQQDGKEIVQARLSFISPYRSTFVFSNRKGQKVAEYSSYQVTSYLRNGRLAILEDIPLFDRAFGNLVNILRKGAEAA